MKKVLLLLTVGAVLALLLSSTAWAEQHLGGGMTASPTATATTLPRSGGPPLVLPLTLVASLALLASGVGALVLLRCSVS